MKKWRRMGLVAVGLVVALIVALPTLVCQTGLRDWAMHRALAAAHLSGECRDLSIGWMSPLVLDGLRVQAPNGATICEIESVRSTANLWSVLTGQRNLGRFDVTGSTLHLYIGKGAATWDMLRDLKGESRPAQKPASNAPSGAPRAWQLRLRQARLVVHEFSVADSLADVGNVDLDLAVTDEAAPRLTLQLVKPLERIPVTPQLCRAGLRFAAPVLAVSTWTQGTVTIDVKACSIPLANPREATAEGSLVLHDVEAGVQDAMIRAATQELAALTGRQLPTQVRLAEENHIDFTVGEGRIHHTGLAVGLPHVSSELVLRSSGYVGLDESLDLELEVPLPFAILGRGPLAQTLGNQTLHMPVTGTLAEPKVSFQGDGRIVSDLLANLLAKSQGKSEGNEVTGAEDSAPQKDNAASDEPSESNDLEAILNQAGQVADLLRQRLEERRKERESTPEEAAPGRRRRPLRDRWNNRE